MTVSIQTKFLAMCILLVLLTTVAISSAYYVLTRRDKERESWQRMQIAFDIILDDLDAQIHTYTEDTADFLKNDRTLPLIPSVYSQDEQQIGTATFIVSFLARLAQKLREFGHIVAAERAAVYAANRRLLVLYQRDNGRELVGGYVVSETGHDAYFPLDDYAQVSTWLVVNHKPIPDTPLPAGFAAYYEDDIPERISASLFSEGQRLGLRIVAPLYEEDAIVGVLVYDMAYTQAMVNRYTFLSKTEVNLFAGNQMSVGTLPIQTELPLKVMEQLVSCDDLLTRQEELKIAVLNFDYQEYYQGGCALQDAQEKTIGAITVSLSRQVEKQEVGKILTAVVTISGVGIGICILLVSGILMPRFTGPILTLTHAALNMARGDLRQPIDTSGADELGTLAHSFVYMRGEIQKKQAALQKLTEELEQRVKERTAEAEAANRAKSEFLANMSHELRTPLNIILGLAQIMSRNRNIPEEERENLEIIRHSGEHLLTLINSVLDLSKIEAGRISVDAMNIDLFCLLDELEEMFSRRAAQKRLHLVFERAIEVPRYIRIDATKLRQVLINLLNNAVKFTHAGGVVLRVSSIANCQLRFAVEDTGPGIASDELASLFEAFRQTQSGRHVHEGTGLGLTISRKFVTLMGGELTVQSELGRGTTFTFAIPVELVNVSDVPIPSPCHRVIALEPGQPRYRVLIVDDKPVNRQLLVKLLHPLGFDVREASDGEAAIEMWQNGAPHLILMDMRMPGMDGYEATKRIREHKTQNPKHETHTIIIALTASSFGDEEARAFATGCDDIVHKPFREEEIFAVLHKHLGVRYVYEEGEKETANGQWSTIGNVLTPADLKGLSNELYAELQQAINTADLRTMERLIGLIREEYPRLAETLTALVKQFRFDILQAVFKKKPAQEP